jgi:hypothetical protein
VPPDYCTAFGLLRDENMTRRSPDARDVLRINRALGRCTQKDLPHVQQLHHGAAAPADLRMLPAR